MATALSFQVHPEAGEMKSKQRHLPDQDISDPAHHSIQRKAEQDTLCKRSHGSNRSSPVKLNHIDLDWLLDRCDGDTQLVGEVLHSFCEQGQHHLSSIRSYLDERDKGQLSFHVVS
jgi:hypothetical protein